MNTVADRRRRAKFRSWLVFGTACLFVLGLGGITAIAYPDLGHASDEFFVTCGHIAPLFGLALFVEIVVVMTDVVYTEGATLENKATVQVLVRTNIAMLVISETAALYAVGAKTSSAFLVVCSVLPWLVQLLLLADTAYNRIGLSRLGSD